MSFKTAVKMFIKRRFVGLYLTEWYKKQKYEALLKRYTDERFVRREYSRRNHGVSQNLDDPQTFSEKLQWLKLHYRDERIPRCTDKALLKGYLAEQGLGTLAVPTLSQYASVQAMDVASLPKDCVIKASHGCGWNVVRRDGQMRLRPKQLQKLMALWLSTSWYNFGREWNYRDLPATILVEPLLGDAAPVDFKLLCFNGNVRMVQVNHTINGHVYVDFYDREWQLLPEVFLPGYPRTGKVTQKPKRYAEMIAVAEQLSAPFPHVRVDMYEEQGRLYVGEMTFFTGSGFVPFMPPEWDKQMGDWLKLPPQNYG